jgi:hypothetical protein
MKLYDKIKSLLEQYPVLRDSDKKLIWAIWDKEGFAVNRVMRFDDFMLATSPESIRRCRQKIQELNPDLEGTVKVRRARKEISDQKGTHIFREKVPVYQGQGGLI